MKILITGGASGLGEAFTKRLSRIPDAAILFTYCNSSENARELEKVYKNVKGVKCDFSNEEDISSLLSIMNSEDIDILVNNALPAGIDNNYFHKLNDDSFLTGFRKNILPVITITREAIKIFRKKKRGKIINVLTSALSNKPPIGYSRYTAEKAYLLSLSKSWATENAAFNITSNSISPSFMQTELNAEMDGRIVEQLQNSHPLKKLLDVSEVAETLEFLCVSTRQINGVNLLINSAENIL
jgi:3-oxoacyl-[acyl-carrier protein] reductase